MVTLCWFLATLLNFVFGLFGLGLVFLFLLLLGIMLATVYTCLLPEL